jgi:hypothetical protein
MELRGDAGFAHSAGFRHRTVTENKDLFQNSEKWRVVVRSEMARVLYLKVNAWRRHGKRRAGKGSSVRETICRKECPFATGRCL